MIAGKTHEEILSMKRWPRYQWYKVISPEEKDEAMRIVKIAQTAKMTGEGNPMYGRTGKNNPNFGRICSEKTKQKISEANKNPSEETRRKNKESHMGDKNYWYGKIRPQHSERMSGENNPSIRPEVRAKQREAAIERWKEPSNRAEISGKNSPHWQGGLSFEPYGSEFNSSLKRQIRSRDNYTCQECHQIEDQLGYALCVHHIDYDKKNNSPENLISLCRSCHSQTNFSREDWTEYFGEIMGRQTSFLFEDRSKKTGM